MSDDTARRQHVIEAIQDQDLAAVAHLVARPGPWINTVDEDGFAPLHHLLCPALIREDELYPDARVGKLLDTLIKAGADPNLPTAPLGGEVVRYPLEAGSAPVPLVLALMNVSFIRRSSGKPPAETAVLDHVINPLLAAHADPRLGPLNVAAIAANLDLPAIVHRLVGAGADVNQPRSPGGLPPLLEAVIHNDTDMVEVLLKEGADPNLVHTCSNGLEALPLYATSTPETLKLLFAMGADPNPATVGKAHAPTAMAAQLSLSDDERLSPLAYHVHKQVYSGHYDQVNETLILFLGAGARLDPVALRALAPTDFDRLAQEICLKTILDSGVELPRGAVDPAGNTVLHYLCRAPHPGRLLSLFSFDPDTLNACNEAGNTPLHSLIKAGKRPRLGALRTLLNNGAEPNLPDGAGKTALDLVNSQPGRGWAQVATAREILLDAGARAGAQTPGHEPGPAGPDGP